MEICDFCGRKVKRVEGTSFAGCYCIECHRLNRAESLNAIKLIQGKPITKSRKVIREQEKEEELKGIFEPQREPFDTSKLFEDK